MRFLGLIFATLVLAHLSAAQAQDPRGYRGRWNNWAHEPMALDRGAWRVTVQAAATEDNEFKIAETQWAYEWTHDGPLASRRSWHRLHGR
jgi:hypothetical protein